jgi:hypothetical protein
MMFALWVVATFGVGIFLVSLTVARMVITEHRAHQQTPPRPSPQSVPRQRSGVGR